MGEISPRSWDFRDFVAGMTDLPTPRQENTLEAKPKVFTKVEPNEVKGMLGKGVWVWKKKGGLKKNRWFFFDTPGN